MLRLLALLTAAIVIFIQGGIFITGAWAQDTAQGTYRGVLKLKRNVTWTVVLKIKVNELGLHSANGSLNILEVIKKIPHRRSVRIRAMYEPASGLIIGWTKEKPRRAVSGDYDAGADIIALKVGRTAISLSNSQQPTPSSPTAVPSPTMEPGAPPSIPIGTPWTLAGIDYTGNVAGHLAYTIGASYGSLIITWRANPAPHFPIRVTTSQRFARPDSVYYVGSSREFDAPSSGTQYAGSVVMPESIGCSGSYTPSTLDSKIAVNIDLSDATGQKLNTSIIYYCFE